MLISISRIWQIPYTHNMKSGEGDSYRSIRYARQVSIDGWGESGQKRLAAMHIAIVSTGGLGSAASLYLAAAGIGHLTLIDNQAVELSNLNRQVLYDINDLGQPKAAAAARRLRSLNPDITITSQESKLDDGSAVTLLTESDLIIDCLDNLETRFALNRYSVKQQVPLLHGGIREYYGELLLTDPPRTACLACLFRNPAPSATDIPVCGATAGTLGTMQAMLAIRWVLADPPPKTGELIQVDLTRMSTEAVPVPRLPDCPVCGIS